MPGSRNVDPRLLREAAGLLHRGGLVAFPTETYYGLGVNPYNREALQRLFRLKQRAVDKAVLLLVADSLQVNSLVSTIPADFKTLMAAFWPGPLTLVFPAGQSLPGILTGGTGTVGLRQSPHPAAAALVREYGGAITATSANISGELPATTAARVREIFGNGIDLILDGGPTPGGSGSTLAGYEANKVVCIRPGKIPFARVRAALQASADQ